jgi:hypothetical protein|tara:strand:+ start:100 stop:387 length:288 start_codon:yes stop_codon:yes gene_type:complete
MSDADNSDDTTFSLEEWAKSHTKNSSRSELDSNPKAVEAIKKLLKLRAEKKTRFSIRSLLFMLKEQYGVGYNSAEGLRYWMSTRLPDEYDKANFG